MTTVDFMVKRTQRIILDKSTIGEDAKKILDCMSLMSSNARYYINDEKRYEKKLHNTMSIFIVGKIKSPLEPYKTIPKGPQEYIITFKDLDKVLKEMKRAHDIIVSTATRFKENPQSFARLSERNVNDAVSYLYGLSREIKEPARSLEDTGYYIKYYSGYNKPPTDYDPWNHFEALYEFLNFFGIRDSRIDEYRRIFHLKEEEPGILLEAFSPAKKSEIKIKIGKISEIKEVLQLADQREPDKGILDYTISSLKESIARAAEENRESVNTNTTVFAALWYDEAEEPEKIVKSVTRRIKKTGRYMAAKINTSDVGNALLIYSGEKPKRDFLLVIAGDIFESTLS